MQSLTGLAKIMNLLQQVALLAISVCWAPRITADQFASIDPITDRSHQRFIHALSNQTERAYQDVLAIYDLAINEHPEKSRPLIEKCKFIEGAVTVAEDRGHPKQADLEDARRLLTELFPNEPEAVLYRAEQLYGDEQIRFLKNFAGLNLLAWTAEQQARFFRFQAWTHYFKDDFIQAKVYAEAAMRSDASQDLSLIAASYYDSAGLKNLVWQALQERLTSEIEPWKRQRKAQLLAKAGRHIEALQIYEALSSEKAVHIPPLEYARVLEKSGRLEKARSELVKATETAWQAREALDQLFRFDLNHGDEQTVIQSYRALCEDGLQVDPLLRQRIAIALKFPTATFTFQDVTRLLTLVAVVAVLVLLPLVWVIPIHYLGLLSASRTSLVKSLEPLWHLGHLWGVSVVWLLAGFLSVYCLQYDEFASFLLDDAVTELKLNPDLLSSTALVFWLAFATGVIMLQRKRHWLATISSRFGFLKSAVIAFGAAIMLRMASRSVRSMWHAATGSLLPPGDFVGFLTTAQEQMILAFGNEYGMAALFVWLVIAAPITEELAFRGAFLDSAARHLPFHVANVAQAIGFAAIHQEASSFFYLMSMGWIGGLMRQKTNGLLMPICFHAANNFVAFGRLQGLPL